MNYYINCSTYQLTYIAIVPDPFAPLIVPQYVAITIVPILTSRSFPFQDLVSLHGKYKSRLGSFFSLSGDTCVSGMQYVKGKGTFNTVENQVLIEYIVQFTNYLLLNWRRNMYCRLTGMPKALKIRRSLNERLVSKGMCTLLRISSRGLLISYL